jgi:hypothetical protein
MTCLRLLFERDARARAEALRLLLVYNARSRALKLITRAVGPLNLPMWPARYPGHGDWDHLRFFEELAALRRSGVDPDQKPR